MQHNPLDLTGATFGSWTVLKFSHRNRHGKRCWTCRCECGAEGIVTLQNLRSGASKSCGCAARAMTGKRSRIHGMSGQGYVDFPKSYRSWITMRKRCRYANDISYARYGGRGIKVHPEWKENYLTFLSYMGECPEGHTLDRIDPDGDYVPGNVRWASSKQQARNKRNTAKMVYLGEEMPIIEVCERLGLCYGSIKTMACRYKISAERLVFDFIEGRRKKHRTRAA